MYKKKDKKAKSIIFKKIKLTFTKSIKCQFISSDLLSSIRAQRRKTKKVGFRTAETFYHVGQKVSAVQNPISQTIFGMDSLYKRTINDEMRNKSELFSLQSIIAKYCSIMARQYKMLKIIEIRVTFSHDLPRNSTIQAMVVIT